jgi:hypothetical protein
MLFAHHLEAHHYPVLACLFAAGFYAGWKMLARLLPRRPATQPAPVNVKGDGNRPPV